MGMSEPPLIEHNPHEKRQTNTIWWVLWPMIAAMWVGFIYFDMVDWPSAAIGGLTLGVLATWAIEVTGNKVPESWRRDPFSRD